MKSITITTQFDGGKYVASIDGKAKAFSPSSAQKAAQKAAPEGATVKEIKPSVYRATFDETK